MEVGLLGARGEVGGEHARPPLVPGEWVLATAAGVLVALAFALAFGGALDAADPALDRSGGLTRLGLPIAKFPDLLAAPLPEEPVVSVLEHYGRVAWIDAAPDEEINVGIRQSGEDIGAAGPAALADRVEASITELAGSLATAPDRPVHLRFWGPWSLRLDDILVTRMMELAVHSDDLAVSVGVPTPELPPAAVERVVDLLTRLAVRRHGPTSVLRALSRRERAPATITAF